MTGDVERRIVSILFCDLVGFTSLSERLDAEDVSILQEAYFSSVRETVGRYGGLLEKFIGDAAVAVFGTPFARDDDAERAVRCGFALVGAMQQVCARLGLEDGALKVRIGVNTGEAVVHADPSPGEAIATGDVVNTSARLQSAAPPDGVLVGPTTALAVAHAVELGEPLSLDLKGKAEPIRAQVAVAPRAEHSREHAMGALRAPMLGRDDEMKVLSEALERARSGATERWLIVAQPGVGKTRLLAEFEDAARASRVPVRRARLRPDVVAPYQAVAQLISSALTDAGLDLRSFGDARTRRIVAAEFLLERLLAHGVARARAEVVRDEAVAITWPDVADAPDAEVVDRAARFAAWLAAFDALDEGGPDAWLIEDVHWAGGDLLSFLDAVVSSQGARLVIATSRPSLLESARDWCREDAMSGRRLLHLGPLAASDAGTLVRALVGDALSTDLVDHIVERSDGNPLFIEELLRTWVSVGLLVQTDDGWSLTSPVDDVPLPATVQSIYAAQLDDLAPDQRVVARRASVAGRRFPLAALPPLGVDDPDSAIAALRRRALVTGPEADPFAGDTYAYRHALLRDAGYASLARAERARLHARLASWIEQVAGDRWAPVAEVVAGHYAAAAESVPTLAARDADTPTRAELETLAATWFERAAASALALAAHDAARTLLERSIGLTHPDNVLERSRRLELLGRTVAVTADMNEGARLLAESMELSRSRMLEAEAGSEDRQAAREIYATAAASHGEVLGHHVRFPQMIQLADRVLSEIGDDDDDVPVARMLLLRSTGRTLMSEAEARSLDDVERALRIARASGDRVLELDGRTERFFAALADGEIPPEQLEELEAIERLARDLGRWQRAAEALRAQGNLRFPDGAAEVVGHADRLDELAEARGLAEIRAWADYQRAEAHFQLGDWDAATEAGVRALDLADRNAYHRAAVRTWFVMVPLARMHGDASLLQRARRWFDERDEYLPDSPYARVMRSAMETEFARSGLPSADHPDASYLDEGLGEGDQLPSWFAAVHSLVAAWIRQGRLDDARRAVDTLDASARRRPFRLDTAVRALERAMVLRATSGDPADVQASARTAAHIARELGAPWWRLEALRALEGVGAATEDERDEARAIERRLGIVEPAN